MSGVKFNIWTSGSDREKIGLITAVDEKQRLSPGQWTPRHWAQQTDCSANPAYPAAANHFLSRRIPNFSVQSVPEFQQLPHHHCSLGTTGHWVRLPLLTNRNIPS
jgi:hypothetical protein